MAKTPKDETAPKTEAVELDESDLDEAQGGIIIINGSSSLTQKVQKVRDIKITNDFSLKGFKTM